MRINVVRSGTFLVFGAIVGLVFIKVTHLLLGPVPPINGARNKAYKAVNDPELQIDVSQSRFLRKRDIRVLCYINTYPENYRKKAWHTHNTWARKCTTHFYTSTVEDPVIPILKLNLTQPETRDHLWSKMRNILKRIYQYVDQYDFFFKADDDTYVVLENFLLVLEQYSPDDPFLMGFWYPSNTQGGYFSGGAGYVVSRAALRKLVEEAIDKHRYCPSFDEDKEDVKISRCGQAVGVKLYRHFDQNSKEVFNWLSLGELLGLSVLNIPRWLPQKISVEFPFVEKSMCIVSDEAATFHYITPGMQYIMEFILYTLRPVGIVENLECG
ncbi:hypothetical protein T265_00032 [Opisthorchis viverrini]|uniref:N-acetylgalactosaminide beta-1,3-galactosyltransferase n=1 Tax=Opisthorchis viverrini TaxID=6198 RepID=A0A075A744_OPIVI|nr:hypothetical protein T265_00032 [Opisthorchis viverrini]KER34162.1 hypothetical protein T265_00032 [Opisthorchis viverrini]